MPLHEKDKIADRLDDDIYCSHAFDVSAPKYRMPEAGIRPDAAYAIVHDELLLDGNARQNLATFCQTWMDDHVHKLMDDCIDKNLIDKDEYPAIADVESRCVHMLADLWRAPDAANSIGCSTTGSSEAAMLGGLALKTRWREKRRQAGLDVTRPNLVVGPVQVCWHKFARYFDVELREIPVAAGRLGINTEEVLKRTDENTIGVVPTFGVTFTCQYEPVAEIAAALDRLALDTGIDVPIHVDGASGGFLAPFVAPDLVWDFRLPRVKSINTSGHKFGLAPLGVGWVVWRDRADLPDDLIFWVNYLGGNMPSFALNFSRPGGQVASQYYLFLRLGREGYRRVHQNCYDVAKYVAEKLSVLGPFEILFRGDERSGIPAVSWTLKPDAEVGFSLFDLSDRLRMRGWQAAAYAMVPNLTSTVVMRVLIRHGFSRDLADQFLDDLERALDYFRQYPAPGAADSPRSRGPGHHAVSTDRLAD